MNNFNDILLKEIKKLNQARRFNSSLNKNNKELAEANSFIIRAKLKELEKRKELGI